MAFGLVLILQNDAKFEAAAAVWHKKRRVQSHSSRNKGVTPQVTAIVQRPNTKTTNDAFVENKQDKYRLLY